VADQVLIFDGHNDVLGRLREPNTSFFVRGSTGHLDLPRAREGGFAGGFFAVWVPSAASGSDPASSAAPADLPAATARTPELAEAQQTAMSMCAQLFRLEAESGGAVCVVRTADELQASLQAGRLATILHFEGAEALDPQLDALEVFYRAGLRSLGPVWSRPNAFAEGVPFAFPSSPDTGPGLTEAGRNLVRACNRLGVMLDLSHLNEQGFWDVAGLSDAPLVATHSNVHAICPSARNLTDRQLAAIKASDGMVGLNFHVGFLRPDGGRDVDTPLSLLVRHLDYLIDHVGIDRVGLGSDFDGATMPADLSDAAALPNLIAALRAHGYDQAALRKIGHENWLRVLRLTWH
jgi:membrane dipeptidase